MEFGRQACEGNTKGVLLDGNDKNGTDFFGGYVDRLFVVDIKHISISWGSPVSPRAVTINKNLIDSTQRCTLPQNCVDDL